MIIDDHWWSLMITVGHWWSLMITDDHWWLLMITDDHWWPLMIRDWIQPIRFDAIYLTMRCDSIIKFNIPIRFDSIRLLNSTCNIEWWWVISDDHWWSLMISDDHWWSLMITDDHWWSLMITDGRKEGRKEWMKCVDNYDLPASIITTCVDDYDPSKMRYHVNYDYHDK